MYQVYLRLVILYCIVFLEEISICFTNYFLPQYYAIVCVSTSLDICVAYPTRLKSTASAFVAALRVVCRKICFIIFIKNKFNFYTLRLYYEISKLGFAIFDTTIP